MTGNELDRKIAALIGSDDGTDYHLSIDASMAVIAARWKDPRVSLEHDALKRDTNWYAWIETRNDDETHKYGTAPTPSHALALALLRALEAEQKGNP